MTVAPKRVIVFMDWQNVTMDARRAFCERPYQPWDGQLDPIKYGRHLAAQMPLGTDDPRELVQVRVYRGRPHSEKDPKTHAAHMRQVEAWKTLGVEVITRDLRYPRAWPKEKAEEKGIDVALAIDVVRLAINQELDVAILATTDSDQKPVLEAFHEMQLPHSPIVEVSTWRSPSFSKKLQIKGRHVWSHFLDQDVYARVRDRRDYNLPK